MSMNICFCSSHYLICIRVVSIGIECKYICTISRLFLFSLYLGNVLLISQSCCSCYDVESFSVTIKTRFSEGHVSIGIGCFYFYFIHIILIIFLKCGNIKVCGNTSPYYSNTFMIFLGID